MYRFFSGGWIAYESGGTGHGTVMGVFPRFSPEGSIDYNAVHEPVPPKAFCKHQGLLVEL
jgi:hypothetical protein